MAPHEPIAAEVRAELARRQLSGIKTAKRLGWTQNYIATRLRGDVPFSIADLTAVADLLGVPVTSFFPSTSAGSSVRSLGVAAGWGLAA